MCTAWMEPAARLGGRLTIATFLLLAVTAPAAAQMHTYTLDQDFDQGELEGVNHTAVADQLQLDASTSTFDFLWVANSQRGTVARIDAATGSVLGEYRTAPAGHGRNPSRTAIDRAGNVWTGNRSEVVNGRGSVVQVGLVIGGTRVTKQTNGTIVPDPSGQWLAPPFEYCTAVDRDGDGLIRTSRGLGNLLAWPDVTDGQGSATGEVHDAEDECIRFYQRTTAPAIYQVSVDGDGHLWAGSYPSGVFDVLDGETATLVRTVSLGAGGYGGFVDAQGFLWSASPNVGKLLRYDIAADVVLGIPVAQSSGLAMDGKDQIWNSMWTNNSISRLDPQGNVAAGFPVPTFGGGSFGVAVAADGDVWVANSNTHTVTRLSNDGALRKRLMIGGSPNGVDIDRAGKVWVTCQTLHQMVRLDPQGGTDGLGAVDLAVPLGSGAGPQDYSDMAANLTVHKVVSQGAWRVVFDGEKPAARWNSIGWTSDEPQGTSLTVTARADDDETLLSSKPWLGIGNGVDLLDLELQGRFIEVRVAFGHDAGVNVSPVLRDLTLQAAVEADNGAPDCANALPSVEEIWPPDHRMVEVHILGITDPDGDPVSVVVTGITQDEPVSRLWTGHRWQFDGDGVGTAVARVRAERDGRGMRGDNGRVYEIRFRAADGHGGIAEGSVKVCVPHDRSRFENKGHDGGWVPHRQGHWQSRGDCVDDGQRFDSTAGRGDELGDGPLAVHQYPNPFNPMTTIGYTLAQPSAVHLTVYDARGRMVRQLVARVQAAGDHEILWDGRDDGGHSMASGVYVYRLRADGEQAMGRMLLVK